MVSDSLDTSSDLYQNTSPKRSVWAVLKWLIFRNPPLWPLKDNQPQQVPCQRTGKGETWVTFINHSTVLIQIDGHNILTDPIWSERCSPLKWVGPKRVSNPGIRFEDLPPIDSVLISHNHYDHMDLPTLKRLNEDHNPQFYVSKGNQKFLEKNGFSRVTELDWWDSLSLSPDLHVHFVPARHFSARGVFDHNKTQWGGFFIKGIKHSVYFAADTGYGSFFKQIKERLGSPTASTCKPD